MNQAAQHTFAHFARLPDQEMDLVQGALLIAQAESPTLDFYSYKKALRSIGGLAERYLRSVSEPQHRVETLNHFLYRQQRFRGNHHDYYDPKNSYLNHVIHRRVGIPITLAIVYMSVAKHVGIPTRGVNFPGHFLVRCELETPVLVDPFFGRCMDRSQCEERLRQTTGSSASLSDQDFSFASPRDMLVRMLSNLKYIYAKQGDHERALQCSQRSLMLRPDNPAEIRDRGISYLKLECFRAATEDLEQYLELVPNDPAIQKIQDSLKHLHHRLASMH